MRTNKEVAEAFVAGKTMANANMTSTGDRLFSYHTCIGESFINKQTELCFIINETSYSNTTARHRNLMLNTLNKLLFQGFIIQVTRVDNVPIGTQSLKQYYNDI